MNHGTRDCPELSKDLDTGFYKSSGGAHNHGGGDDDESARQRLNEQTPLRRILYQKRCYSTKYDGILCNSNDWEIQNHNKSYV